MAADQCVQTVYCHCAATKAELSEADISKLDSTGLSEFFLHLGLCQIIS